MLEQFAFPKIGDIEAEVGQVMYFQQNRTTTTVELFWIKNVNNNELVGQDWYINRQGVQTGLFINKWCHKRFLGIRD